MVFLKLPANDHTLLEANELILTNGISLWGDEKNPPIFSKHYRTYIIRSHGVEGFQTQHDLNYALHWVWCSGKLMRRQACQWK